MMASNTNILVVGETRDGQVPVTDFSDASVTDIMSRFFPQIFTMNERTKKEVQQLFLGKCLTQKRTALLKKAFTQIRTTLPQKTNRVQPSLHRVKRFLHLLSNSLLPSQKRGFLHETGFLCYEFSTSHFIDGRVFFKVSTLKWCVFFLNRLMTQ